MNEENEVITELKHEPEPGYGTIFYIVFLIMGLYLVIIMATA